MTILSPLQLAQQVLSPRDYEGLAAQHLDKATYAYLQGGSGQEHSLKDNQKALQEIQLNSRILHDITTLSSQAELFGETLSAPILLAPVAHQGLVFKSAEIASAQAAKANQLGIAISTYSSRNIEDIAENGPDCRVFQLYLQKNHEINIDLIKRAQAAGYKSIMLTLDTSLQSVSLQARRLGFNLQDHLPANLIPYGQEAEKFAQELNLTALLSQAPKKAEVQALIESTDLPVWVKGVMLPDDADFLKQIGVAGIVVSNHGGRALDGSPSPVRVLPKIRATLGKDFPILMDSGIRDGYDVFKALASGANGVMLGRLQIYALAVGGAVGVAHMLKMVIEELQLCMALTGCASINEINESALFMLNDLN